MSSQRLQNFSARVGGPRAISWATFVVLVPLAVLSNTYRIDSSTPVTTTQRIGFAAFTLGSSLLVLLAARWLFGLRRPTTVSPLWLVLGTYTTIGLLRSIIPTVGSAVGILPSQALNAVLVLQGVVVCVTWCTLIAYVMAGFDQERDLIVRLQRQASELSRLRSSAAKHLTSTSSAIQSAITAQVVPALDGLLRSTEVAQSRACPPQQLRALAEELRTSSQESVRILAQQLTEPPRTDSATNQRAAKLENSNDSNANTHLRISVTSANPFAPGANAGLIFVMFLGTCINLLGLKQGALIAILIAAVNFTAVSAARQLYQLVGHPYRTAAWFGLLLTSGFITGLAALVALAPAVDIPALVTPLPITLVQVWIGTIVACARSTSEQLDRTRRALETTRDSYELETLGLDAATDAIMRRTGLVLHGEIQGRLVANALRLDLAAESADESLRGETVQKLQSDLLEIANDVTHVTDAPASRADLAASLTRLVQRWDGIVTINIESVDPQLLHLAAPDAAIVTEIVREGINNAAKHARATSVRVQVSRSCDVVHVVVTDNGTAMFKKREYESPRPNLPFTSADPKLSRKQGHTRLDVKIPIAALRTEAAGLLITGTTSKQ